MVEGQGTEGWKTAKMKGARDRKHKRANTADKAQLTRDHQKSEDAATKSLPWLRPRIFNADASVSGLHDRQEHELMAIQAIFEGAVKELPLHKTAVESSGNTEDTLESKDSSSTSEIEDYDELDQHRPSTPVRRYLVKLSARSSCNSPVLGPSASLEVRYGRLYPQETPGLRLRDLDGLPRVAQEELHRRVEQEVALRAGQECVYEVCEAVCELLKHYHDPSAEMPLHERMQRRHDEEEERRRLAQREGKERAEQRAAEEWERKVQAEHDRLLRYQEKQRAAKRVGETSRGGNLDFLPEESEGAEASPVPNEAAAMPEAKQAVRAKVSPNRAGMKTDAKQEARAKVSPKRTATKSDTKQDMRAKASPKRSAMKPDTKRAAPPQNAWNLTDSVKGIDLSARFGRGGKAYDDDSDSISFSMQEEDSSGCVVFEAEPSIQPEKASSPGISPARRQESPAKAALPKRAAAKHEVKQDSSANSAVPKRAAAKHEAKQGSIQAASSRSRYAADFEELRFLGRGGFGSVTKVRHRVDRQLYAIKRIELMGPQRERDRIMQECALLPRLTHLHIVRYYQAWIEVERAEDSDAQARTGGVAKRCAVQLDTPEGDDWLSHTGTPVGWQGARRGQRAAPGNMLALHSAPSRDFLHIQMEYCDGNTLKEVIQHGELQQDEALIWKLFRQVLDALAYVHSKGLIHRDLKPPNIFLSKEDGGHAKLGDFGLTTEVMRTSYTTDGEPHKPVKRESTAVGTHGYMAPEVRNAPPRTAETGEACLSYDQQADMFSLGVVFFEMWHPPFPTAMERQHVLEKLTAGLDEDALGELASVLPKESPKEVHEILASLLAKDPSRRTTADHLLDGSGLLPASAFDPQVQRMLKALANPSSSESVALIQALFSRTEEPAKDVSFFEQLFRTAGDVPAATAEARDSALQLVRELCRKHGAVFELCPLLRPVHQLPEAHYLPSNLIAPQGRRAPRGCQLVDAGNTLLELRTNLTEPFARTSAAQVASNLAADESGPSPWCRRAYHVGTVYREAPPCENFTLAQYGHPKEISSAVIQFLWVPAALEDASVDVSVDASRQCRMQGAAARTHEAELLHLLGELLAATGIASQVELQLTDTRLVPLLLECALQRALREQRSQEHGSTGREAMVRNSSGQKNGSEDRRSEHRNEDWTENGVHSRRADRLRTKMVEALRLCASRASIPSQPVVLQRVAAELAAMFVGSDGQRPCASVLLTELEEQYAAPAAAFLGTPHPAVEVHSSAAEQLWEVLRGLRNLVRCLEGILDCTIDILQPVDGEVYGPGLAFCILDTCASTVICLGGRIDQTLSRFATLHSQSESPGRLPWPVCGVSAELAMDKIAEALVQAAQSNTTSHVGTWKRAPRSGTPTPTTSVQHWWRQPSGCWAQVLVGAGVEADPGLEPTGLADEALKVACGLWRLGARCEVRQADAGPLDTRSVLEHFGGDALVGPVLPDFIVTLRWMPRPPPNPGGAHVCSPRSSAACSAYAPGGAGNGINNASAEDDSTPVVRYFVKALSESGIEAMERATKDGTRDFDERSKVFEFFEKLARRIPVKHMTSTLPRGLEALHEH